MKPGDIILIKFPFTDLSQTKLRPALVIANPDLKQDIILCAISSQFNKFTIPLSETDLSTGNLPIKSYICYQKIITINKNLVIKEVASLNKTKFDQVKDTLIKFLKD